MHPEEYVRIRCIGGVIGQGYNANIDRPGITPETYNEPLNTLNERKEALFALIHEIRVEYIVNFYFGIFKLFAELPLIPLFLLSLLGDIMPYFGYFGFPDLKRAFNMVSRVGAIGFVTWSMNTFVIFGLVNWILPMVTWGLTWGYFDELDAVLKI